MPGIQIRSNNFEGNPRQLSESNIKHVVSPNSKYPYPSTVSGNLQATGNSRTPNRPTTLQTQQLQNILNRNYIPSNNNNQNNFLTSPSNQITQGEKIVIKSGNKSARKSNYDRPNVSINANMANYDGNGVKQSGVYTSRTQIDSNYMSNRNGSIGANPNGQGNVVTRGESINKVSTRRIETSGLSNTGDSSISVILT